MIELPDKSSSDLPLLQPEEHVLSTLEADGSRRWLKPRLSRGKLLQQRRWVAYLLIAVFTILPFLKIDGRPLFLLDIVARRFTIFGFTMLPTDTVLLAVFLVGLLLTVFLFTALFGRVWCGWACPQTVYMEFVFRPIERIFDRTVGRGGPARKGVAGWRTVAKYVIFLLVSFYLANTFLAYFVGVDELARWMTQSPIHHPVPFLVMLAVTVAMMFDFCFFREQLCLIACPYGRFQSVLLDQNSMIVAYDRNRGEPRGKIKKKSQATPERASPGDCVDCGNCVTTCPTGIDIREGLQMECINCTQCIDACNLVMDRIGREPNLIRYSSQSRDAGQPSPLVRARTLIYPVLLLGVGAAFLAVFFSSRSFDAVLIREPGNPHTLSEDGRVRNLLKLKLTSRSSDPMNFTVHAVRPQDAELETREDAIALQPGEIKTFHVSVLANREQFVLGRADLELLVENDQSVSRTLRFKLIGPYD